MNHTTSKRKRPVFRSDGYVNLLNKYGTQRDSSQTYAFEAEPTVPDVDLAVNYEGNGLFAKIIDRPAEEAVKHGIEYGINDADVSDYLDDKLDALDWEGKAATAIKWARLFGGAIIVMLIDDGRGLEEPVDWENIRDIDELKVFERPIVQPEWMSTYATGIWDDERPFQTGEPESYQVSSVYGTFSVHRDRCLVLRNGVLPEFYTNETYRLWGMPEYIRIRRELVTTVTTHGNGSKLLEKSVQAIYKMAGLASLLATENGEEQVLKRLQLVDASRGILNSIAIDSSGEDYDFKTFQLSGVKDIIDASCNMLSAVTCIPQTILFGRSPAGENSTGDSDMENYYNYIENIQKLMLKKNIRTLLKIIMKSGLYQGKLQEEITLKPAFKPLWSLNETEQATVEQARAATALTKAQTTQLYVDMQALDPSEVRSALAKSEEYIVEDILDEEAGGEDWGVSEPASAPDSALVNFGLNQMQNGVQPGSDGAIIQETEADGGPGSGRYPKGSGGRVSAKTRKKYEERLKSVTTPSGTKVNGIGHHAMQRMIERKISEETAADVLESAPISYPGNIGNRTVYQKGTIKMVLDNDTGFIVTAIDTLID